VRRKFADAVPSDPKLAAASTAAVGIEHCNKLLTLEREFESLTSDKKINMIFSYVLTILMNIF